MINRKRDISAFIISMLTFILTACSSSPSNSEIEAAVKQSLEKRVPVSLAKHLTGGEDAIVEEVKVIKVGQAQGKGSHKYWPVIIYARGTCVKMFGGRQPFEGQAEYYIRKNAYGEWVAQQKGF